MLRSLADVKFGTDGIRGVYGDFPINPAILSDLTQALVNWLQQQKKNR